MEIKKIIWTSAILTMLFHPNHSLNAQHMNKKTVPPGLSAFPAGNENPEQNAKYFTGQSYLAPLTQDKALNCPVYHVTFEPGCRNNWHSHTGGQILIITGGRGFYQEKGKDARPLMPGDVVEIVPDIVHWHGAAPDSWFSHLAVECNPQTNKNTWYEPVDDREYAEATSADNDFKADACRNARTERFEYIPTFGQTDPELARIFTNFAFGDTQQQGNLDTRTRFLVTMASTIAQHTAGEYRKLLAAAWENGMTPVEIKEILYHAVPYAGIAKVAELLDTANTFLTERGVKLPLEPRSVVTSETRMEKGLALQKSIFGNQIDKLYETSPADQLYIQQFLSANCFGDYQTRPALDIPTRELLTFSILLSLGGCESQLKGHIRGNVKVGNDKATLLAVITQLLPYIGYPRTLNAITCLNEVISGNES